MNPERTKATIDIVGTLVLLLPFAGIMMYYGYIFANESYSFGPHADTLSGLVEQFFTTGIGERSQDPGGLNNRFVIKSVIPLAFTLTLLSGLSVLIANFKRLKALKQNSELTDTGADA